ncbi:MAG: hypothetical protein J2O46_05620 [Nocardioides sp.]|nr:hypothetical protein [Nocardioides sp.]
MPRQTRPRTRGRLPASVYWRRRLAVISIGVLLVIGLTRLVVGGGDSDTVTQVAGAGKPTATVTVTPTPKAPAAQKTGSAGSAGSRSTSEAAVQPTASCQASDVVVKPAVARAYAYDNVTIRLLLRTAKSPACVWKVSADALQVRVSSKAGDLVWGTVDCPQAVPNKEIVVRHDTTVTLPLVWSSRRVVAGECTSHGPWVQPSTFTVVASSLGGEPASTSFALYEPGASFGTPSMTPSATTARSPSSVKPTKTGSNPAGGPTAGPSSTPAGSATGVPTGHPGHHRR